MGVQPPGGAPDVGLIVLGRCGGIFFLTPSPPRRSRRRRGATLAQAPAARDGLPEILLIGQPLEPGPKLVLPVPVELFDHLVAPVDIHSPTLDPIADSFGPRCAG